MVNITNPYENIDFSKIKKYKASLHSHIRPLRDNQITEDVINELNDLGFDIYARTEKNEIIVVGGGDMHVVPAYERTHDVVEHNLVLYPTGIGSMEFQDKAKALQISPHPQDPTRDSYTKEELLQQFQDYRSLVGIELTSRSYIIESSQGDAIHPHRRGEGQYVRSGILWDYLLKNIRYRNIYAFGATDAYNDHPITVPNITSHYNVSWNDLLMDGIDDKRIKETIKNGAFFAVSHMDESSPIPSINDVSISNGKITVNASNHEKIYWFYNNGVVAEGNEYDLTINKEGQEYVRFEVWSQPSDWWEGIELEDRKDSNFYSSNFIASQPFVFDMIDDGYRETSDTFNKIMSYYY